MITLFLFYRVIKWIFRLLLAFIAISLLWVVAYRFVNPPTTALMSNRSSLYYVDCNQTWVDYENIGNNIKMAVICGEDQRFKEHHGFDFKAIQKAIQHNMSGGKVRGASTISQQTAKNVFLWQGRSWIRKGLEVYFTFMIELIWGKKRILEVYLNVIEMGPGVFGIEAAAQHYFNKPAAKLTRYEAALIAASLPNPKRYRVQPASRYMQRRASFIVGQMHHLFYDKEVRQLIENR